MGVLDDAIREHLELKRRHGASEEEISRQEAEALGPARRVPVEPEPELGGEDLPPPVSDEAAPAVADEPVTPADVAGDGLGSSPGEPPEPMAAPEPLAVEPEPLAAGDEAVPREPEPLPPDPEPPPPDPEPLPPEPAAQETVVHETPVESPPVESPPVEEAPVDEGPVEEGAGDGDDLLEETPDFLQDTPDHDRLWFEQKPPRDFDLD